MEPQLQARGFLGEEAKDKQGQISGAPGQRSGCGAAGRKERGRGPGGPFRTLCFSLCVSAADQLTLRSTPRPCLPASRRCQGPLHPPEGGLRPTALATLGGDAFLEFSAGPGSEFYPRHPFRGGFLWSPWTCRAQTSAAWSAGGEHTGGTC